MWEVTIEIGIMTYVIAFAPKGSFDEFAQKTIDFWQEHGADSIKIVNKKGEKEE